MRLSWQACRASRTLCTSCSSSILFLFLRMIFIPLGLIQGEKQCQCVECNHDDGCQGQREEDLKVNRMKLEVKTKQKRQRKTAGDNGQAKKNLDMPSDFKLSGGAFSTKL